MSAAKPTGPGGRILFMGEQEDPELENLLARGNTFIYGLNRTASLEAEPEQASPAPKGSRGQGGLYVLTAGRIVKCGCGRCVFGPCPSPAATLPLPQE